ncbi:MAG: hypothetical protein KC416_06640, partial [Myxococcales bacterium]|nr:hypothetical protein [Myxococcales bacterium]
MTLTARQLDWTPSLQHPRSGLPSLGTIAGGRYTMVRSLCRGARGALYEGRDELRGRPVAIQILEAPLTYDAPLVRRLIDDLETLQRVRPANTVRLITHGRLVRGTPSLI